MDDLELQTRHRLIGWQLVAWSWVVIYLLIFTISAPYHNLAFFHKVFTEVALNISNTPGPDLRGFHVGK